MVRKGSQRQAGTDEERSRAVLTLFLTLFRSLSYKPSSMATCTSPASPRRQGRSPPPTHHAALSWRSTRPRPLPRPAVLPRRVIEPVGLEHDEDCPPGCPQRHAFHYVRVPASRSTAPPQRRQGRRLDLVVDLQEGLRWAATARWDSCRVADLLRAAEAPCDVR